MTITAEELLKKIKSGLGITGDYQDEALMFYIDEVKGFMKSSGVPESIINDSTAVGVIMRGVADLWNYGSGSVKLSDYFVQRVLQLVKTEEPEPEPEPEPLNIQPLVVTQNGTYNSGKNVLPEVKMFFSNEISQNDIKAIREKSPDDYILTCDNFQIGIFVDFNLYNLSLHFNDGTTYVYLDEETITAMAPEMSVGWYEITNYGFAKAEPPEVVISSNYEINVPSLNDLAPLFVLDQIDGYAPVTVNVASKLPQVIDDTITDLTEDDLAGATKIRTSAFYQSKNLKSVVIPGSVIEIEATAFFSCDVLSNVVIQNGTKTIGNSAFYGCYMISEMTIPESVETINDSALNCGPLETGCTFKFLSTTPPSIFQTIFIPSRINKIIVPNGCADVYKSSGNWTYYASYIVEESDV